MNKIIIDRPAFICINGVFFDKLTNQFNGIYYPERGELIEDLNQEGHFGPLLFYKVKTWDRKITGWMKSDSLIKVLSLKDTAKKDNVIDLNSRRK